MFQQQMINKACTENGRNEEARQAMHWVHKK
jgi:hypothetical protein